MEFTTFLKLILLLIKLKDSKTLEDKQTRGTTLSISIGYG